ncbi:MAG TPA: ABC transporter ATP-binding protein [Rhodobacteraceae bacterium]|nr:ABC transporter ATP-binding protein [Paracoccaceae bacterium]
MLELVDLHVYRGATHVLKGVSLSVARGQIIALIGANGAGKSTTLQTISGLLRPRSGSILLQLDADGAAPPRDQQRMKPEQIVAAGVIHCPEGRQIFSSLTVEENLDIGGFLVTSAAALRQTRQQVYDTFPILYERRRQIGGSLSGGEQMMLAMGRALMAQPKLLLLDEPSLGLAPQVTEQIFDMVAGLKQTEVTILLVEQNAAMALEIADRGYVMETGEIKHTGTGADLLSDDAVRRSYLGGGL